MSVRKAQARRQRVSGDTRAFYRGPIDTAVRKLAHAVAMAAERAATHELIELHVLTDVLVALVSLIERGLKALNEAEAWS